MGGRRGWSRFTCSRSLSALAAPSILWATFQIAKIASWPGSIPNGCLPICATCRIGAQGIGVVRPHSGEGHGGTALAEIAYEPPSWTLRSTACSDRALEEARQGAARRIAFGHATDRRLAGRRAGRHLRAGSRARAGRRQGDGGPAGGRGLVPGRGVAFRGLPGQPLAHRRVDAADGGGRDRQGRRIDGGRHPAGGPCRSAAREAIARTLHGLRGSAHRARADAGRHGQSHRRGDQHCRVAYIRFTFRGSRTTPARP